MNYKVGVIKRVAFLLMTMALAVAMVACEGAVGKPGLPGDPGNPGQPGAPGEPGEPGATPILVPLVRAPIAPVMLVEEGEAKSIDLSAHFYDPEGQALTYGVAVEPAEGVVTTELAQAKLTITPVAEGEATITVTATDPDDASTPMTIMVTVSPEGMMPPMYVGALPEKVAIARGRTEIILGSAITGSFKEDEGEALTYSVSVEPADSSIVHATMANDNSVTIVARGIGKATVTITATDEDEKTAEHKIAVTVVASLQPEATGTIAAQSLTVGDDPVTVDVAMYFKDPAGDKLDYTAVSGTPSVATASADGSVVTITAVAAGTAMVTVTATNSSGLSVDQMISVTVSSPKPARVPKAPVKVGTIAAVTLDRGEIHPIENINGYFNDPDGQTLGYKVSIDKPLIATPRLSDMTLSIRGDAYGTATVTVTATDEDDLSVSQEISVTVAKPKPPPPLPVPTVAPTMTAEIGDMMLYLLDDAESIDLSEHFAHADEITYTATVRGSAVDAEVSGSTLTVTPVLTGDSRVTVTATVGDKSIADSFMVNVKPGSTPVIPKVAPTKVKPIIGTMIYQGDGPETINLSEHFSHENEIMYEAAVRGDAVDAEIAGSILMLDPVLPGSARVTVTATADGKSSSYAFTVTVKAGTKPPPPPPEDIDEKGTIDAVTVKVDETKTVNVADKFTITEGVSYEVDESNDKATATVDASGMVSITGKKVGPLSLTVTATDARDNEAMQTIAVTVTPMMVKYKPNTVTIKAKGETEDIGIDSGQTLQSLDDSIVSVRRKAGNVWTLTGERKGPTTVRILKENGTIEKSISVTVKNSPPELKGTLPSARITLSDIKYDDKGTVIDTENNLDDLYKIPYHLVKVPFGDYFVDKDGMGDIKEKYDVTSAVPGDVEIVDTVTDGIVVNVIRKVGVSFALTVHAVDKEDKKSGAATFTVSAVAPHPIRYRVGQEKGDGILDPVTVEKRYGTHMIQFKPYNYTNKVLGPPSGFNFVELFQTRTRTDGRRFITSHANSYKKNSIVVVDKLDKLPDPDDKGVAHYTVTGTGSVELVAPKLSFDKIDKSGKSGSPMLEYKLKAGSSGSVIIVYSAITCVAKAGDDTACDFDPDVADYKWESVTKTLRVTIK